MEKGFDLNALLTNYGNLHKAKPQQFTSVSNGVKKRLETTSKRRRSSRLTIFDKLRNLPQNSPVQKISKEEELRVKAEHRKLQLEKWKEEKAKKKKEAAAIKKKPFVVGAVRPPPKLEPLPKVMPSMSGRVTRSQVKKINSSKPASNKGKKSFAPENASFCPPVIKGMEQLPILILPSSKKGRLTMVRFEPVLTEIKSNDIPSLKSKKGKDVNNKGNRKTEVTDRVESKSNCKVEEKNKNQRSLIIESPQSDESESSKPRTRNTKNTCLTKNNKTVKNCSSTKNLVKREHSTEITNQISKVKVKSDKVQKKAILSDPSIPEESEDDTTKDTPKKKFGNRGRLSAITIESSGDSSPVEKKNTRKSLQGCKKSKTKDLDLIEIKDVPTPYISIDNSDSSHSMSPIVSARKSKSLPASNKKTKSTPVKPIPNSESSSEERLRSPQEVPLTPEQISELANLHSPCITTSRGKDNARKEMQKKLKDGLLDDHIETMDTVNHFHRLLNMETNRLTEMADHWEKIMEQNTLPDFVQEAILAAVGQARLLMSQKFQQFAGLVDRCDAADPSQPLVTPVDLQGFWDMVYMQVENLDVRFAKLGEMQARGWAPEKRVQEKKRKAPLPKAAKPATTSRIKHMIAAARKAKKEQEEVPERSKTFEAGFFSVQSPIRSPAAATPNKAPPTLLKAVLSSEAKKASASKNAASYAMLRVSMIEKSIEPEYDSSMNLIQFTPVDLKATPGRSILKSGAKSTRKSLKMVLFDSSDTNIMDSSLDKDISGIRRLESEDSPSEMEIPDSVEKSPVTEENEEAVEENVEVGEKENIDKENEKVEASAKESKRSKKGRQRFVRQDALDFSPRKTRSGRKSETPRKEILQETNPNTPRRSLRRKSQVVDMV